MPHITAATKIRTNPDNRFRPATSNRGSRGIRDQPRNSPTHTEKRIRISPAFPCPSVLLTFKIFEACADFLTPDGLGSCRKRRNFGAHRSLVQSCGCGLAALGVPWLPIGDDLSCRSNYPKSECNPRKIQDLRTFSDSYGVIFSYSSRNRGRSCGRFRQGEGLPARGIRQRGNVREAARPSPEVGA